MIGVGCWRRFKFSWNKFSVDSFAIIEFVCCLPTFHTSPSLPHMRQLTTTQSCLMLIFAFNNSQGSTPIKASILLVCSYLRHVARIYFYRECLLSSSTKINKLRVSIEFVVIRSFVHQLLLWRHTTLSKNKFVGICRIECCVYVLSRLLMFPYNIIWIMSLWQSTRCHNKFNQDHPPLLLVRLLLKKMFSSHSSSAILRHVRVLCDFVQWNLYIFLFIENF